MKEYLKIKDIVKGQRFAEVDYGCIIFSVALEDPVLIDSIWNIKIKTEPNKYNLNPSEISQHENTKSPYCLKLYHMDDVIFLENGGIMTAY